MANGSWHIISLKKLLGEEILRYYIQLLLTDSLAYRNVILSPVQIGDDLVVYAVNSGIEAVSGLNAVFEYHYVSNLNMTTSKTAIIGIRTMDDITFLLKHFI